MFFIWHKAPDTDAVVSSIVAANIFEGIALISDELNKETKFVLDYFNVDYPEIKKDISNLEVCILDHNQITQSPEGIKKADIKMIIDHHPIWQSVITTNTAIDVLIKPLGSTATIIYQLAKEKNYPLNSSQAGLLLAGIISDTLAGKSPTTTKDDLETMEKLQKITTVDNIMDFTHQMFSAKSNLDKYSVKEIIKLDYKNFEFKGKKIGIGTIETVTPKKILDNVFDYLEKLKEVKKEEGLDYILLMVVDVLNKHTDLILATDEDIAFAENIFGGKNVNNILDIADRVSRKKQIVPAISNYLER